MVLSRNTRRASRSLARVVVFLPVAALSSFHEELLFFEEVACSLLCPKSTQRTLGSKLVAALSVLLCCVTCNPVLEAAQVGQRPPPSTAAAAGTVPGGAPDLMAWVHARRWTEVEKLAQERIKEDASDSIGLFWLGVARFNLRDFVGAALALRSAEKLGLESADLHIELGQAYYGLNQFRLFEQQMQTATKLDPKDGTPTYLLGLYHLSVRSDPRSALPFLTEAVRLRPKDAKSSYQLGYCLEASGQSPAARAQYAQAIDLVRESKEAFSWPFQGMARLLLNENPQQALEFAREAVQLEPNESANHLILAKLYERLGNLERALSEANLAKTEAPNNAATRYLLFRLYRREGALDLAEQERKTFEEINAVYAPE